MSLPTTFAIGSIGALAATGLVSFNDLGGSTSQHGLYAPTTLTVVAETYEARPVRGPAVNDLPRTASLRPEATKIDWSGVAEMTATPNHAEMQFAQAGTPTQLIPATPPALSPQAKPVKKNAATKPVATPAPAMAEKPVPEAAAVEKPETTTQAPDTAPAAKPSVKAQSQKIVRARVENNPTASYSQQVHGYDGIIAAERALLAKTAFLPAYQAHIASFASEEEAMLAWEDIASRTGREFEGVLPRMVRIDVPERGTFVRLVAGDFGSIEASAAFCARLAVMKSQCRIMRNATSGGNANDDVVAAPRAGDEG